MVATPARSLSVPSVQMGVWFLRRSVWAEGRCHWGCWRRRLGAPTWRMARSTSWGAGPGKWRTGAAGRSAPESLTPAPILQRSPPPPKTRILKAEIERCDLILRFMELVKVIKVKLKLCQFYNRSACRKNKTLKQSRKHYCICTCVLRDDGESQNRSYAEGRRIEN